MTNLIVTVIVGGFSGGVAACLMEAVFGRIAQNEVGAYDPPEVEEHAHRT